MNLLRVMICGSVDDGKSTLVGRLFQDFGHLKEDHLKAIDRASRKQGLPQKNLALFTDGLKSEVEQGITIDVAYRYLNLPDQRLIIADAPGHLQYTRNMVTACSQVEAIVLMIDASAGLKEQTLKHLEIATWMNIPRVLLCVNKMDLVNFSSEVFEKRIEETQLALKNFNSQAHFEAIPFCAVEGYGISTFKETPLSWFSGKSLLEWLKSGTQTLKRENNPLRISIQGTLHPKTSKSVGDRRFMGVIHSGTLSRDQKLKSFPSHIDFTLSELWAKEEETKKANPGDAISFQTTESVELTSGELIIDQAASLPESNQWQIEVFNLSQKSFSKGERFLMRTLLTERKVILGDLPTEIAPNEKGSAVLKLQGALAADLKSDSAHSPTSQFILISESSGNTVGCGFFIHALF